MNFHDVNCPKFIEIFAIGQPCFNTSCISSIAGREIRRMEREYSLQKYSLQNCRLSQRQFEEFNSFFRARRGRNFAFRFRDRADYQVKNQIIAIGPRLEKSFQLYKTYKDALSPYIRAIRKPVRDSVKLYINDQETAFIVDYSGIVHLNAPLNKGETLKADFMFDVSVRFANDSFDYSYGNDGVISLSNVDLLEMHL